MPVPSLDKGGGSTVRVYVVINCRNTTQYRVPITCVYRFKPFSFRTRSFLFSLRFSFRLIVSLSFKLVWFPLKAHVFQLKSAGVSVYNHSCLHANTLITVRWRLSTFCGDSQMRATSIMQGIRTDSTDSGRPILQPSGHTPVCKSWKALINIAYVSRFFISPAGCIRWIYENL